ncbi:MAG TPA: cation:proton antiporter [Candidatus Eisenbacteria bacterium]|jgi:CPA2 family monovalent cation:H+ antiporter-2|nr:cation:proton antiporter [Candidatus Eisenbacteria bacterium]
MHGESSFLRDFVVALAGALIVLVASRRFKIPAAVGFMLTGVLIGPGALGWIADTGRVGVLAEIGVSVLLFIVGLEFSLARLREIGRAFLVAGPLQVVGTIAVVTGVLMILPSHAPLRYAIFAGMLVALSSTAMVMRLLSERGETQAPQGRLLVGILLFQDIAMVPMLILTPALAGSGTISVGPSLLIGLATAALFWIVARYLTPRVVNTVIRTGIRELYVMMAVAVCMGAALLTQSLGLSPALGAFLAGLLVSESEYSHQIIAEIVPFRDLFSSLFFISIGMLLAPAYVASNLGVIGGWLVLTVAMKAIVAAIIVWRMGYPRRVAALVGLSLAQVGEFSFVLATVGMRHQLITAEQSQQFFAVAVLSLMGTPFMIQLASWVSARFIRAPAARAAAAGAGSGPMGASAPSAADATRFRATDDAEPPLQNHVIVAGYGVNGRNVARTLRELGIPYVVMEMDPATVRRAKTARESIRFGDVSRHESLRECAVGSAAVVVLAISDLAATRYATAQVKAENPDAYVIARTRFVAEVAELARLGANEVIPEEFETSIAIVARVLRHYHVPGNVIRLQESALRRESYAFLRGRSVSGALTHSIEQMMAGAITDTFFLEPSSNAVGKTLEEIDLRGRTRALVIALVRGGEHRLSPDPDMELQAGDILVLVGDHKALDRAFRILGAPELERDLEPEES